MATLWFKQPDEDDWTATPLDGATSLSATGPAQASDVAPALLIPAKQPASLWALLVHADHTALINGERIPFGIRVLRDRDSIRIDGGGPFFFSVETPRRVEPAPCRVHSCPRCTLPIEVGDASLKCPSCQLRYHHDAEASCWTYHSACQCGYPTQLDGEFAWIPEEEC